ncbi:uncharacterized protein [Setaria viridis]|uniref:uncharacterized protein n=1 Tax=Setaria viridis TaxID=4556 RepID=UPI003B3B48C3
MTWLVLFDRLAFVLMSTSSATSECEGNSDSFHTMDVDESDDTDDDYIVAMLGLDYMASSGMNKKKITTTIARMTGIQWVELQLQDPVECFNMFRMRRSVFLSLHDTLVQDYGLRSSIQFCSKEALGMFLCACGAPQSFRQCKNNFHRSLETVSRKFEEVLESIMRLAVDIVRPKDPQFSTIHPKLQEARFWPHFKDCIGAIDGTHIPVTVPLADQPKYIGRHGYPSQNVMAVCDFDMRFTFAVTGWPGSVHDTRVLLDTLLTYRDQFPHPPDGKYYLVDSGYPNRKGFLAPYKGQRYHVSEWQHGQHPVGLKEVFNHAHSSLRNVIERSFGVLKMKWRILLNLLSYPVNKQSKIIVACMALHNFIRDSTVHDVHFEEDFQEDDGIRIIVFSSDSQ